MVIWHKIMALAGGSLGIEPTTIHGQLITIIYKVDDTIPMVERQRRCAAVAVARPLAVYSLAAFVSFAASVSPSISMNSPPP